MRGLRKYLKPFAPDQSGAVSVLYELGGLIAICDAGGCTGNVCGFDRLASLTKNTLFQCRTTRNMDIILRRMINLVNRSWWMQLQSSM